jgi:CheY-like chemotaxis protein
MEIKRKPTWSPKDGIVTDARVLVAHRTWGLRGAVRFDLERAGFTCDEAKHGEQALRMIGVGAYEVALVGAKFEFGMTGWGLVEQAREVRPNLSVVVFGGPPIRLDDWRIAVVDREQSWPDAVRAVFDMFERRAQLRAA